MKINYKTFVFEFCAKIIDELAFFKQQTAAFKLSQVCFSFLNSNMNQTRTRISKLSTKNQVGTKTLPNPRTLSDLQVNDRNVTKANRFHNVLRKLGESSHDGNR